MFMPSQDSPFSALWYLYLIFLGAVILVNIICLIISGTIAWRTRAAIKKSGRRLA